MAYDEAIAQRIRDLVAGAPQLTEKKMFGGLAFLVGGNMAIAASGQGGILVRVDPEESSALVAKTAAGDGHAGPPDGGMAPRRRRRRAHEAVPRRVGEARHGLRGVAAGEVGLLRGRWRFDFA